MIKRVRLENWKSHYESELTFSSGINALVGEMGSGKSSVLEAITFALYGTTPALQSRKVTLDNVLRRHPTQANEAVIEADFTVDGEEYTVKRVIERGKGTTTSELRKDGELIEAPQTSAVTAEVEDLLGIEYDLYERAIYAEQNNLDAFLEMRAGDRKEKIDELLRLDKFESARSTLVTVINRLTDRRKNRQEDIEELKDEIEEEEREALIETLEKQKEAREEMREEHEELAEALEELAKTRDELAEKKETYEEMKERRTALKTRIETLEERIEDRQEVLGEIATFSADELDAKEKELTERKETLEDQAERIEKLENKISILTDRRERLQEKKEELEEQVEKLEDLDEIEDDLNEKNEALTQLNETIQECKTRQKQVKESLQNLSKASETCPTCGRELTEEHRVEFLKERKQEQQELADQVEDLSEQKKELTESLEELKEVREELLSLKGAKKDLEELEETREELTEALEKKTEALEDVQDRFDEDEREEIADAFDAVEDARELLEWREEHEERTEQLEELIEALEDLEFDADRLEDIKETIAEKDKRKEVLEHDIKNKTEMITERTKRLEQMDDQIERLEEYTDQVATYRRKEDFLNDLMRALEGTQIDLRERFVEMVNDNMMEVWDRIYPYDDYRSIRLNAAEDYRLELEDTEAGWVPVDGEVSGGERHSAALTLRIALAIILSPSWRILILDEPTHNLDSTAIEELSDTLRTTVSDLVTQLFLITHEERLETAATGELYKLQKKTTRHGMTEVEAATGE